jgi:hypothetical protein
MVFLPLNIEITLETEAFAAEALDQLLAGP